MRRRAHRALLLVVGATLLSGCLLELDVNVEVREDGSGAVEVVATLDREAVARIGGDLDAVLALDDLRAGAWIVDGPDADPSGGASVRVRKAFADAEGAAAVFEEIAGDDGPFQGFRVTRDRSLTRTEWGFGGTVDFSRELGPGGGVVQARAVDGEPLAGDLEALEDQLGESLSRLLRVRVGVRLPGEVDSNATTKADNGAVWQVAFGGGPVDLEATGSEARTGTLALLGVAVVVAVTALLVLLVRLAARAATPERTATDPREPPSTPWGRGAP
ncbi:MAG: hypothetical protein Q8K58_09215 [Acidimicrobiales bacterium]|nr:hypothetical protein [Acidimicrobiales bacterium]